MEALPLYLTKAKGRSSTKRVHMSRDHPCPKRDKLKSGKISTADTLVTKRIVWPTQGGLYQQWSAGSVQ